MFRRALLPVSFAAVRRSRSPCPDCLDPLQTRHRDAQTHARFQAKREAPAFRHLRDTEPRFARVLPREMRGVALAELRAARAWLRGIASLLAEAGSRSAQMPPWGGLGRRFAVRQDLAPGETGVNSVILWPSRPSLRSHHQLFLRPSVGRFRRVCNGSGPFPHWERRGCREMGSCRCLAESRQFALTVAGSSSTPSRTWRHLLDGLAVSNLKCNTRQFQ